MAAASGSRSSKTRRLLTRRQRRAGRDRASVDYFFREPALFQASVYTLDVMLEASRSCRAAGRLRARTENERMAGTTGLEPATSDVTGRRSNQLNYVPAKGCIYPSTTGSSATMAVIWLCLTVALAVPAFPQPAVTFPDGVASGDVTHSRAVVWTRTSAAAEVTLEVAEDSSFTRPLFQQRLKASADAGFTVKYTLRALEADTVYHYRWRAGASLSEAGTFRTAPLPWDRKSVRFVFSGDSDATKVNGAPGVNRFEVLEAARKDDPAFFVYLGDTIYTDSLLRGAAGRATTFEEFRQTYRAAREIPALRDLLRTTPAFAIWDDHEVADNWNPITVDPFLFARGRQAFLEFLPLGDPALPVDSVCLDRPLFRYFRWGSDVDLIILDERSCRSKDATAACLTATGDADLAPTLPSLFRFFVRLPSEPPRGCREALAAPGRTMIGPTQKWLLQYYLLYSTARFKFVINPVAIQEYFFVPYDRWEGYAAERAEILNFIRDHGIRNVIFLTADTHANLMNAVFVDRFTDSDPVAYEFIAGPIAADTLEEVIFATTGVEAATVNQLAASVGADCWDLNAFGYGLVEVNADAGTATVSLKNDRGEIFRSKGDPRVLCTKTFGP
jgi:alkaline phosphatase D